MELLPDLHGILSRYELLMLLRALRAGRFTGRLSLTSGDERVQLHLNEGQPVHARSLAVRHTLPAYLLRQRLVPRDTLRALLRRANVTGQSFDRVLVDEGVMPLAELRLAKRSLGRYVLTFAFALDPAAFEAWRTVPPPEDLPPMELDVEGAFFRFVAQRDGVDAQTTTLRDRFERRIAATPELRLRESTFRAVFGRRDPLLDRIIGGSASIAGLMADGHDAFQVVPRVFALHRVGMIRFVSDEEERGASPWDEVVRDMEALTRPSPASEAPPPRMAAVMEEAQPTGATVIPDLGNDLSAPRETLIQRPKPRAPTEEQIVDALIQMADQTHYELLGVAPDAPLSAVRAATERLRSTYSAAALAGQSPGVATQRALRAIAARLDQAHRTLSDPRRRKTYNAASRIDEGALNVTTEAIFEADEAANRAREARERGDLRGALIELELAAATNPLEPDYANAIEQLRSTLSAEPER